MHHESTAVGRRLELILGTTSGDDFWGGRFWLDASEFRATQNVLLLCGSAASLLMATRGCLGVYLMNALSFAGHCDCCGPTIVRYYSPGEQYSHVMPYCDDCGSLAYSEGPRAESWLDRMDARLHSAIVGAWQKMQPFAKASVRWVREFFE